MRPGHVLALAALALLLAGCSQPSTPPSDVGRESLVSRDYSMVSSREASASGVVLGVRLGQRSTKSGKRFQVESSVRVVSQTPVTLKTPDGLQALVVVRSLDTSRVVFDSRRANADALASNPGFEPQQTDTLEDGSGGSVVYEFSLSEPGRYELTAQTFGPAVSIKPMSLDVN